MGSGLPISKGFNLEGGFLTTRQFKDAYLAGKPESYFLSDPWLQSNRIVYSFADGYSSLFFSLRARISYDFGPLTIRYSYDWTLTPLSRGVSYEQTNWPISFKAKTWMIGVTYTLLR
jgi:hypothetical protein